MNEQFLQDMQDVDVQADTMTHCEMQRVLTIARAKMADAQRQAEAGGSAVAHQTAEPFGSADAQHKVAQEHRAAAGAKNAAAPECNATAYARAKPPAAPELRVAPLHSGAKASSRPASASHRKRRPLRTLLIAAAVTCGLMVSVYAVSEFYKMQQGDIPFYDTGSGATSQLANLQPQMESYNAAVNQSVEHAGITLTLDNVAVSGNVVSAFFTLRSAQPIGWAQFSAYGDGVNEPDWLKLQWASSSVGYKISGESGVLCESYAEAFDYHKVDDNTFQYMVRIVPTQLLPDMFTLSLQAQNLLQQSGNSWNYVVPIDITDMAKPAALQTQDIALPLREGTKTLSLNYFALTQFGATAAAKPMEKVIPADNPETEKGDIERVENAFHLLQCQITDDKGNTLYPLLGPDGGGTYVGKDVSVEYAGSTPDAKSITFTPISVDDAVAKAQPDETRFRTVNVTEIGAKLEMTDIGGYIFKDYKVEDSTITVVLEPYGFAFPPEIILNDEGVSMHTVEVEDLENPGQMMETSRSGLMHRVQDYKTGDVTVSVSYYKATNEELSAIESFTYRYDAGYFLDTAAAVTLPLE